jgi:carbon starvation protein
MVKAFYWFLHGSKAMTALPFILIAVCLFAIAYRYYSAFLAAKVLALDDSRVTPALRLEDGHNYVPTNKWVLFGHHFAAITGAGPLIGPVLAAQFGFLPGFLWLVVGVVISGAVHDLVVLVGSVRQDGKSLAEIARAQLGPWAGRIAGFAILFIIIIALAGLGVAVVNALQESPWAVFTLATTVPTAFMMGWFMHSRGGSIPVATAFGVVCLILAVILGKWVPETSWGHLFDLSRNSVIISIAVYGFVASVLPVWILLCPRDYLSSFMKLGTIAALTIALLFVNPVLHMPMVTEYASGGGPIVPGKLFPFVFVTIACGAISGFHALISSGTTPKMITRERDCRMIGYGAMLCESWVGLTSLIAAAALFPADYFAINVPPEKFAKLGLEVVNLPMLAQQVGEEVAGRTGGAVSLAVGMAQIFSSLPGLGSFMAYWYHFAILFEALFILTAIDTGTRVARFLVQEMAGKAVPQFAKQDWVPGTLLATSIVVMGWAGFIWSGSIATIWPLFGIANQLLAAIALAVGTTLIMNSGRGKYAWVTAVPLVFIVVITVTAGIQSIFNNYLPLARQGQAIGYLNSALIVLMIGALVSILAICARRWAAPRAVLAS